VRSKVATWLMWISALLLISGCSSMSTEKKYGTLLGASSGALIGGGLGCGIAAANNKNDDTGYVIGCPVGVVAGAIIGGVIGYVLTPEAPMVAQAAPPPPPPPPAPPPPPPPPPAERIILRGVHFDFDRANIRPDAVPILNDAADILNQHSNVTVDVDGYCDSIGAYPYNLKLSVRRADSVANYLETKGIPANRLVTHGYGKTHFVATNATSEGRAQNRRVELVPESQ
jgi:outer membrane protein OmpA-like peptidoglycan-associated protein